MTPDRRRAIALSILLILCFVCVSFFSIFLITLCVWRRGGIKVIKTFSFHLTNTPFSRWFMYPIRARRIDYLWRQADGEQSLWAFCSFYVVCACVCVFSINLITYIYCLAHLTQHCLNFIFSNMAKCTNLSLF